MFTRSGRLGAAKHGHRLQALEERSVPAILTVTASGDSGGAGQLRAIWESARTNSANDTINFDPDVTTVTLTSALNSYSDAKNLTINGNGKNVTVIRAPANSRIFAFSSFFAAPPSITITDLKLLGGHVTAGYGGAISFGNEPVTLTNVAFSSNIAELGGGALSFAKSFSNDTPSISISGCDFTANTATTPTPSSTSGGGAVYFGGAVTVSLNNCVFDGNRAVSGSALFSSTSIKLNSDSSTFKNGVSTGTTSTSGGALFFMAYATVLIDHSTATGNSTGKDGGFLYTYNPGNHVTVQNSIISSNTAGRNGGGLRVFGSFGPLVSTTILSNDTFTNNVANGTSATDGGGAVYAGGILSVNKSLFSSNTSAVSGGAIYGGGGGTTINTSIFKNNMASSGNGGALGLSQGNTINFSQFESNTASGSGGALFYSNATVTVNNSTFFRNKAGVNGGGINSDSTGSLTINQSTFSQNTAGGAGGGAISQSANAATTINNCVIYDNTASGSATTTGGGGFIWTKASSASGAPKLNLISTIVANNLVTSGTKGIDLYSSASTVSVAGTKNLIGTNDNSSITFADAAQNQIGTNFSMIAAKLAALADNGGEAAKILPDGSFVKTMAPMVGSPALNQGLANGFTTDQRGAGFARDDGNGVDVGAFELLAPTVATVTFGDGTDQRSLVKQMVVTFSESVSFTGSVAAAFTLHRTGTGGTIGDVALAATPASGPANMVTLAFSGSLTEFGSLVDGFYDFTIDATQVSGPGGPLDGDNNGLAGGNYSVTGSTANQFFRLYGDSDGNGRVSQADFQSFFAAYGAGPSLAFDFNNDNQVDSLDFIQFRNRFNTTA